VTTFGVGWGIAFRTLKKAFTQPAFLIPSLMFPVIFFLGFAGALSRVDEVPGFDYAPGYETFQFAFVLLQSAAMGGVFTGFGIAQDFERGFARRLMIGAPQRGGILLGYALATLVRSPVLKLVWTLWPTWVWFTVMATGNHFWLDVAAGVGVAVLAGAMLKVAEGRRAEVAPAVASTPRW